MKIAEITAGQPLWHGTDVLALASIISSNMMSPSIDDSSGVSLTRSQAIAWSFADRSTHIFYDNHASSLPADWQYGLPSLKGAVLQLDTVRLARDFRLIEVPGEYDDEEETRLMGNQLHGLNRYLVGFEFAPADASWFAEYLKTPAAREDWTNPDAMAQFLLGLTKHRLFRSV